MTFGALKSFTLFSQTTLNLPFDTMSQIIKIVQSCIILALCMALTANANIIKRPSDSIHKQGQPKANLIYLGQVSGKPKFYHIDNVNTTWAAGKARCAQEAMTLATIEDADDLAFLVGRFETGIFHGRYWTGGRDSHTVTQLVWDKDTSALPAATVIGLPQFGIGYGEIERNDFQTCLSYISDPLVRRRGIAIHRCDGADGHVLCECTNAANCGPNL